MPIGPDSRDLAAKRALAGGAGFSELSDEELLARGVDPREIYMRRAMRNRIRPTDVPRSSSFTGDPRETDRALAGVDAQFEGPVGEEASAIAARAQAQGARQGQAQSRQMQFGNTGVGLAQANPDGARSTPYGQHALDAEGAQFARDRARAMATTAPATPLPGAVGPGARAQFYAGQPGGALAAGLASGPSADQGLMREARGMMAGANGNSSFTELNPNPIPELSGLSTRDGQAAARAMALRADPKYQEAIAARKLANAASVPGGSPQDSALPPILMGSGSRPPALEVSPEQRAAIAARAAGRQAKADAAQGKVNDFAMNKRAARQARMTGLNPQVTSPSLRDAYNQQAGLTGMQSAAAVEAARLGQQGAAAYGSTAIAQAMAGLDLSKPEQMELYKQLMGVMDSMAGGRPRGPGGMGVGGLRGAVPPGAPGARPNMAPPSGSGSVTPGGMWDDRAWEQWWGRRSPWSMLPDSFTGEDFVTQLPPGWLPYISGADAGAMMPPPPPAMGQAPPGRFKAPPAIGR